MEFLVRLCILGLPHQSSGYEYREAVSLAASQVESRAYTRSAHTSCLFSDIMMPVLALCEDVCFPSVRSDSIDRVHLPERLP